MDRLILCGTCAGGEGVRLAEGIAGALPDGVSVDLVDCLNVCDRPVAMALRGPGKDVYLFAGVAESDVQDAACLAHLYARAPGGRIVDARPAGRLRHCLLGRVPRLSGA